MTKEIREDKRVVELKEKIESLIKIYHKRKEELQWADDEWEISEIQEDLDNYAKKIKKLKLEVKKYQ